MREAAGVNPEKDIFLLFAGKTKYHTTALICVGQIAEHVRRRGGMRVRMIAGGGLAMSCCLRITSRIAVEFGAGGFVVWGLFWVLGFNVSDLLQRGHPPRARPVHPAPACRSAHTT